MKSVLKIRNKGISGLPLKKIFPVPFLLHNSFRDLDVKETQRPYQIRLIYKYLTYKFADTSKKSLEVYLILLSCFKECYSYERLSICIKKNTRETICHIHHNRPCLRFQRFYILRISKILQDQRLQTKKKYCAQWCVSLRQCFSSIYIKFLLDRDIFMYFYSSTDKILNILLITSVDSPKRNMFKRNMFKPENRKFLVYYVIFWCIT